MRTFNVRSTTQNVGHFQVKGENIDVFDEKVVIYDEEGAIIFIANNSNVIVHEKQD